MSTHLHLSSSRPTTAVSRTAAPDEAAAQHTDRSSSPALSFRRGYHCLLLGIFIADEDISRRLVSWCITSSFVLMFFGLSHGRGVDGIERWIEVAPNLTLVLTCFGLIWNCFLALLWVLGVFWGRRGVAKPNLWIKLLARFRILHWYLVTPFVVWVFSSKLSLLSDSKTSSHPVQNNGFLFHFQYHDTVTENWILLSSSILLALVGSFARNTIPSSGPLSVINPNLETAVYLFSLALVFLNQNVPYMVSSESHRSTLDYFSIISSILSGVIVLYFQIFWSQHSNSVFTRGFFQVGVLRICLTVLFEYNPRIHPLQAAPFVVICHLLISRLMKNVSHLTFLIRTIPIARRRLKTYYYAVFTLENYADLSRFTSLTPEEQAEQLALSQIGNQILRSSKLGRSGLDPSAKGFAAKDQELFSKKIFGKHNSQSSPSDRNASETKKETERNAEDSQGPDTSPLWVFYQELLKSNPTSTADLMVLLQLQIIFLVKCMTLVSKTFNQIGQSLGEYKSASFDLFHLEQLFQARLTQLHIQGIQTAEMGSEISKTTFSQLYKDVCRDLSLERISKDSSQQQKLANSVGGKRGKWKSKLSTKSSSPMSVDISRVLSSKHSYLHLVSQTTDLLGIKHSVYSHLYENYSRSSSFLFKSNAKFRKMSRSLDNQWSRFVSSGNVPLYSLVAAVNYFLKVRNDIRRAELIFKAYRDRLYSLDGYHGSLGFEIDSLTLYQNSVAMRINMTKGIGSGSILDISANYAEHLGVTEDEDETKLNINMLFPGEMAKLHYRLAAGIQDTKIFNKQTEFQVNGFDGFLRPVKFLLKLSSSVGQGINTMALLKFREKSRQRLVIADEDLNIISAEVEFWEDLESLGLQSPVTTIPQLSKSLALHVNILKYLHLDENEDGQVPEQPGGSHLDEVTENPQLSDVRIVNPPAIPSKIEGAESSLLATVAKGIQNFTSYTKTKQRVLEHFYSTRRCGILHALNPELGVPIGNLTVPLACTAEKWNFKEMPYYRVWVTIDTHLSRVTKTTGTDFRHYENFRSATSEVEISAMMHENKQGENDSGKDSKGSLKIANLMGMPDLNFANPVESSVRDHVGFDQLLDKIRVTTQVLGLFTEAQQKVYPAEIQKTLKWVSSYYSGAEPTSPISITRKSQARKATFGDTGGKANNLGVDPLGSQVFGSSQNLEYVYKHSANSLTPMSHTDVAPPVGHRRASAQVGLVNSMTQPPNPGFKPLFAFNKQSHERPTESKPFSVLVEPPTHLDGRGNTATRLGTLENQLSTNRDLLVTEEAGPAVTIHTQQDDQPNKPRIELVRLQKHAMPNHKQHKPKMSVLGRMMTGVKSSAKSITSALSRRIWKKEKVNTLHESTDARKMVNESHHRGKPGDATKMEAMGETKPLEGVMHLSVGEQVPEILLSSNKANIQALVRAVAFFSTTAKKPIDPSGAQERNESVSTTSTTSNNRTLLKSIQTTLKTRKHGTVVFIYTAVLSVFSIYFFAMCEYIISQMQVYNKSNLNNFLLVKELMLVNRKQLQGCELAIELLQVSRLAGKGSEDEKLKLEQIFKQITNPPANYQAFLRSRLTEVGIQSRQALAEVKRLATFVIDAHNAVDFGELMMELHPLGYIDRLGSSLDPFLTLEMDHFQTWSYYQNAFIYLETMLAELGQWNNQNNSSHDDSRWDILFSASKKVVIELTTSILDINLSDMVSDFEEVFDTMVQGDINEHLGEGYLVLGISTGVFGLLIIFTIWTSFAVSRLLGGYIETYGLLKPWELHSCLEELQRVNGIFEKFALNELHLVGNYLEFFQTGWFASQGNRMSALQERYSREKGGSKFKRDYVLNSIKLLALGVLAIGLMFGLLGLTVLIVVKANDNRLGMQFLIFDAHKLMTNVSKNYLGAVMMPVFGEHIKIAGTSVTEDAFKTAVDQFVILESKKRRDFESYFSGEEADLFDKMMFGDICSCLSDQFEIFDKDTELFVSTCRVFNQASATRGLVGFLEYQGVYLEGLRNRILVQEQEFLKASQEEIPDSILSTYFFSKEFVELRVANWLFLEIYYYLSSKIAQNEAIRATDNLTNQVTVVMFSLSLVLAFLILLFYLCIIKVQINELRDSYETFRLIDPYFLINNKLVQHKFKASFKGVS